MSETSLIGMIRKLRPSKTTLWFTALGFLFALVEVVLSVIHSSIVNPIAERVIGEIGASLLLVCPFALAEAELPNVHILADRVWIYVDIMVFNTLLYFVLGLICSSIVNIVRGVIANRPR
jgi:hypothetical protein